MTPFEMIQAYSKAVCGQIRWKKAHAVVSEEIENHLVDQRNAYMADGTDESAATEKAIAQMGDPAMIGKQLNRTHRPKPQWTMLVLISIFFVCGIALQIYFNWGTGYRWMLNLFITQIIGLTVLAGAYFMGFAWIGRHPRRLYVLVAILFAILLIFQKPALLYVNTGSLLLLFPLGFAGLVYGLKGSGFRGIWFSIATFTLPAVFPLLLNQKSLRSECMLLLICGFTILSVAVFKQWFGIKPLKGFIPITLTAGAAVAVIAVFVFSSNDRLEWVLGALNPSHQAQEIDTIGWQIKAPLAGSKFIGHGMMPDGSYYGIGIGGMELLTGLIFNAGWITLIPIIGLLAFFIGKGFWLCLKQNSVIGQFLSLSIMMVMSIQTIGYVLFNLGFYVLYPISLPLVTEIHTAKIYVNAALIGMMLSVFRTGHVIRDRSILTAQKRLISFQNGKLSFLKK